MSQMDAIESERQGRTTNLVVDGMEDIPEFWQALGEKTDVASAEAGGIT